MEWYRSVNQFSILLGFIWLILGYYQLVAFAVFQLHYKLGFGSDRVYVPYCC